MRGRPVAITGPSRLWVLIVALIATIVSFAAGGAPTAHPALAAPPPTVPTPTVPTPTVPADEPVTTANPFLPEEQDITDCVGLVERPGCGSESRGGLHQNLVAIVMIAGLLLVFGRVAWVIRRSHQRAAAGE